MNEEETKIEEFPWKPGFRTDCPYCGEDVWDIKLNPEDKNVRYCICYECGHQWIERKETKGN